MADSRSLLTAREGNSCTPEEEKLWEWCSMQTTGNPTEPGRRSPTPSEEVNITILRKCSQCLLQLWDRITKSTVSCASLNLLRSHKPIRAVITLLTDEQAGLKETV